MTAMLAATRAESSCVDRSVMAMYAGRWMMIVGGLLSLQYCCCRVGRSLGVGRWRWAMHGLRLGQDQIWREMLVQGSNS